MPIRSLRTSSLVSLLLFNLLGTPAWAQNPTTLQIEILEGEGAINNIRQRVNRDPIVQVEDENHRPIAGAAVIFFLPNQGPGGTFANGSTSFTTSTNSQGQAVARGIRFNNQSGPMEIRVAVSYAGLTASTIITQTNIVGAAGRGTNSSSSAGGGMSLTTKILLISALAGAGVAAAVLAGGRSSSSTAAATTPTVTITPGTVTVGGPQ